MTETKPRGKSPGRPTLYGMHLPPYRITPEMKEYVRENGGADLIRTLIKREMDTQKNSQK